MDDIKKATIIEDGEEIAEIEIQPGGRVTKWTRNTKPTRTVVTYVCAKCFNSGGTMINVGTRSRPAYIHRGICPPVDIKMMNRIKGIVEDQDKGEGV